MDTEHGTNELDLQLFRIWRKAMMTVMENTKKDILSHGLCLETFMILELLYSKGPQSVQKISEKFFIPSGSITYVVDKLEKKNYVSRQAISTDRRVNHVVLTDHGHAFFDDIFSKHTAVISKNFSFVSKEEKILLMSLLKKIGLGASQLKEETSQKGGESNG